MAESRDDNDDKLNKEGIQNIKIEEERLEFNTKLLEDIENNLDNIESLVYQTFLFLDGCV